MANSLIHVGLTIAYLLIDLDCAFAQRKEQFHFDHKVIYEVTYLSDSIDPNSKKQEMTELLIGGQRSLFRSFQKAFEDSSYMAYIRNKVVTMSVPIVVPMGEINVFNYQILKDWSSGHTKVYDEYTGSILNNLKELNYYFEDPESMKNWVLFEDTLTINNHRCQRAEIDFGGREWTAWFSTEMSAYPDGPYKFRGLPGLIFRVHDAKKNWDFELVDLSKVDTTIHINFKEGLEFSEIAKQQLYKDRRHFQKSQVEISEAAGNNFGESRAEIKSKLEEYILRDNNWIELFP